MPEYPTGYLLDWLVGSWIGHWHTKEPSVKHLSSLGLRIPESQKGLKASLLREAITVKRLLGEVWKMKLLLSSRFFRSLNSFEPPFLYLKNENHVYLLPARTQERIKSDELL